MFPGLHYDKARGSWEQCYAYATKAGNFVTAGLPPSTSHEIAGMTYALADIDNTLSRWPLVNGESPPGYVEDARADLHMLGFALDMIAGDMDIDQYPASTIQEETSPSAAPVLTRRSSIISSIAPHHSVVRTLVYGLDSDSDEPETEPVHPLGSVHNPYIFNN